MNNKIILILVPAFSARGGISNYYQSLENKFNLPVQYFVRGARKWPYHSSALKELFRLVSDWLLFFCYLLSGKYSIVQTTTSLGDNSITRDGIFLFIARLFRVKTIVFYRGWDVAYKQKIDLKVNLFFKKTFLKSDAAIVLSSSFKDDLTRWGYKNKIFIETTNVDESLFSGIDIYSIRNSRACHLTPVFLFLSRVEKAKGIYEAINAYEMIKRRIPDATLIVAGDGRELDSVKEYVSNQKIEGVSFRGFVKDNSKVQAFLDSDIYLFPSYTEGMPNSVLEAMAFGLPVLATHVGGLNDILEDGRTGFFINSHDVDSIVYNSFKLFNDVKLFKDIVNYNIGFAKESFYTSTVIKRIEGVFSQIIND